MSPPPELIQLVSSAAKSHAEGRLDDAEAHLLQALESAPDDAQANLLMGVVLSKKDRFQEALSYLNTAAAADAGSFFCKYWQAVCHRELGNLQQAASCGMAALHLNPDDVQALILTGSIYLDLRQFQQAGPIFTRAVRLAPRNAAVREGLGLALQAAGKQMEAAAEFRIGFEADPTHESLGLRLGSALLELQDFPGAESCAQTVLKHHPNSSAAKGLLARTLSDQAKGSEALGCAEAYLAAEPRNPSAHVVYGSVLQNLGRIQEAEQAFRSALDREPTHVGAFFSLTHNRKFSAPDEDLLRSMEQLESTGHLPISSQIQLEYALGKARHDLARFEDAMRSYDAANRLALQHRFGGRPYSREAHQAGFEFLRRTFSRSFIERHKSDNASELPVFVVGMMRSGTTLVEQILSSHTAVGAAGEQSFWPKRHTSVFKAGSTFDPHRAGLLGQEYVQMLSALCPDSRYVVDKMPVNYSFLGTIHAALPHAKVIHVRRHPVDTGLSIYFTPNRSRIEWAHDKSNIAFAYQQYQLLMNHWADVLPGDQYLEVRYEELVLNRETATKRMFEFLNLEWEDAAMHPERNERVVLTPSVWQVRQPVYATSIERWRPYEPWLGALKQLMPHEA